MADKIKKVSMTNTKKELLEAYDDLVSKIKEQQELQLNPQKIAEEKSQTEIVQKVDGVNLDSVVKTINELKSGISSSLNNIEVKLEKEVKKYEDIQKAIEVKENEIKEIFEIEKSAYTLAALIESQNQKKIEFEEEMDHKKSTTLKEIDNLRVEWEKEKKEHENSIKERDEKEKKEAARQKEEFDYNFKREKQIAHDKLNDELKKQENEFNKLMESKKEELNKRESIVTEKETRLNELEEKVQKFNAQLDEAITKAVSENTKKLQAEFKNKEDFITKEFEGKINVFTTKIESYEKTIGEQNKKITELTTKLDEAYSKVQDVAVKTIESASNTKAFSELQKALSEKYSNKNKE